MPTKRRSFKRIVLIGDFHCGHRAGLTPPEYRYRAASRDHIWQKFTSVEKECWDRYIQIIKRLRPIDCLVVNGDGIDGRGERSGGVELITSDRSEQCEMAEVCIEKWDAPKIVIARGTPYHTGEKESWEDIVAKSLRKKGYEVKIGDHEWVDVNGHIFDCKHHIGGSGVPHGRLTAIGRDEVWNALWHEAGLQPRADHVIRSHVHYHVWGGRMVGGKPVEFVTLPALQAMGTRFGARKCSGTVDWGVIAFDVDKEGDVICEHKHVVTLESTKAKAYRV